MAHLNSISVMDAIEPSWREAGSECKKIVYEYAVLPAQTKPYFILLSYTAAVGLLYPHVDKMLGRPHKFKTEWSSVMRCIAVFVGINHASAVSFTTVKYSFSLYPRLK